MFWRLSPDGVAVAVKVQPKSRRPGVQGRRHRPAASGCASASPRRRKSGRANRAACAALAPLLDIAPSAVSVSVGATSREKTLRVAGDVATLGARLAAL